MKMVRRLEFTARTKAQAFARADGCCERGRGGCGVKLGVGKAAPEYDHIRTAEEGGDNSLENCAVLCKACHAHKTHKVEAPGKAKGRRNLMKHQGQKPPPRNPLPGSRASRFKQKIGGGWVRRDE